MDHSEQKENMKKTLWMYVSNRDFPSSYRSKYIRPDSYSRYSELGHLIIKRRNEPVEMTTCAFNRREGTMLLAKERVNAVSI